MDLGHAAVQTFGQKLARVNTSTGEIKEFSRATFDPLDLTQLVPFPSGMMTGADGNLYVTSRDTIWFGDMTAGKIGRFHGQG